MVKLTVERLFDSPPLTGNLPAQLKIAPDGSYVTYLKPAAGQRERLDLWRFDIESGRHRCWLDVSRIIDTGAILSDAEKAERERKRLFSTGVTSYEFSPSGACLLLPIDGAGYLFDVAAETLTRFTPEGNRQTDFHFSPKGTFISYVRAGDLYYLDTRSDLETRVTDDGGGLVSNGIADFIAAEEMHRFDGHWWSPDELAIAFTRVDSSTVAVSQRYEIDADAINVIEQRYPYAGASNASIELRLFDITSGTQTTIDWQDPDDEYLARIDWAQQSLVVQVQTRDQRTLRVDLHEPNAARRTLLTEQTDTWVNLHDNFHSIDADRFLWTSERDGASQIYLYSNGEAHQLTRGAGRVDRILHADSDRVLFSGWQDTPTEQHLFSITTDGATRAQLTTTPGWHELTVSADGNRVVDRMTSLEQMGAVRIRELRSSGSHLIAEEVVGPAHPYFPYQSQHSTPQIGSVLAEDGQLLYYRLTRPQNIDGARPLIVHVYGGPGVNRVRNEYAPLILQLFASRGFGVLELDNRGSSNRSREFEGTIHRQLGDAEVRDQLTGVQFARSLDWVDGERIGVFGHSYGGFMALMCLAREPSVFKAAVSVAPVSQWELYDTHYTERYLGTPAENPQGYEASSVFPYLDQLRGKLLIIHGMADDNVLFTHSTRLIKALQTRLIPFEMMAYPGSKHALQEQNVSVHRFNLIVDFFERNLS